MAYYTLFTLTRTEPLLNHQGNEVETQDRIQWLVMSNAWDEKRHNQQIGNDRMQFSEKGWRIESERRVLETELVKVPINKVQVGHIYFQRDTVRTSKHSGPVYHFRTLEFVDLSKTDVDGTPVRDAVQHDFWWGKVDQYVEREEHGNSNRWFVGNYPCSLWRVPSIDEAHAEALRENVYFHAARNSTLETQAAVLEAELADIRQKIQANRKRLLVAKTQAKLNA